MRLTLAICILTLAGCIHVRAQSTAAGTSASIGTSSSGTVTGAAAVCQITTTAIPPGTQGVFYTATLASLNCPAARTWSISTGSLPAGLSLNASTGVISGTPSSSGSSSFTVKVVGTPSTITDIFDTALSITSSAPGGGPAPPDSTLLNWDTSVANSPSPNTLVTVGDGSGSPCDQTGGTCSYSTSQISLALASVGCGQTLELQNVPMTLSGTIRMQNNCDASNWITVTRDFSDATFPAEGTRVTPCYAGMPSSALPGYPSYTCASPSRHMPLLLKSSASSPIQFGPDAVTQHTSMIRFVGIQFGRPTTYDLDFGILSFQNTINCVAADADCMNHQPNHIILDRCIIQGDAQRQTTRGVDLGGQWIAVIDSYVYDIQLSFAGGGGDSQAFHGGGGKYVTNVGFWKMQNTFAASSTMGCLFCGVFVQPVSPITTFDGIPHDIWWNKDWFYKNPYWDDQIGQAMNETINLQGVNYGPTGDQEFIVTPSAASIQQGTTYALHNVTLNDSGGGFDRMFTTNGAGGVTVDGLACTETSTTTAGTTPAGTTVTVVSVANLAVNRTVLIVAAASGGANYTGTITNITGTTLTVSPATGASVTNASVFEAVCLPGGDSTHGLMLRNSSHAIGSSPYQVANIISWTYIACSAAGTPYVDCTGPTTTGAHPVVFSKLLTDGRAATMDNNRTLTSTATMTVTSGAPTPSISISPSAPDLQIQPSYPGAGTSDASGNSRQYCYLLFETPNYTQGALTWKVDTITGGNSSVGTVRSGLSGLITGEAIYCSGSTTGNHTVSVTDGTATGSDVIIVSNSAPIVAMDFKPFTSKNGWETKCVSRGLFDYSLIENAWGTQANGGFQPGEFILNQPSNQASQTTDGNGVTVGYGPEFISDLKVDHVHGIHASQGIIVASLSESKGLHNVTYSNLLLEDLSGRRWRNGVQKLQFADVVQYSGTGSATVLTWTSAGSPLANDITFDHITSVGGTTTNPGVAHWISEANNNAQFQLGPFSFTNSILTIVGSTSFNDNNGIANNCNKVSGSGTSNTEALIFQGTFYAPPKPCNSTYSIARNALVDHTANPNVFTSVIWQPTSIDSDLFRNNNAGTGVGGDYRVVAGGQYDAGGARDASDGLALGADTATIYSNDQAIRLGVRTGFPLSISTSSLSACTHNVACSRTLTASGGTAPYTWTTPSLDYVPGGAIDTLDYAAMPLPDRNNFHLSGTIVKYFKLDAGLLWWMKNSAGRPWDGEVIGSDYIKQWFTENVFSDPNTYKMYQTPVSLWKRYHVPGADDVVYTAGPNKYATTGNCGADGSPLIDNLGVRGELTGPFTDVAWQSTYGGDIPDGTPYLLAQKWIKCTSNDILSCTNEEDYWLVKGYGQVRWCPKTLSGGVYVTGSCSQETSKVAGGAPTPNFACGLPQPPTSTLPPGALLTSAPAMTLVDSTGEIKGIPNLAGSYTFTIQVQDANGLIAQKTFTLTVN